MNPCYTNIFLFLTLITNFINAQNPGFSASDYKKALWMTTRFYGAQRAGENNWLLHGHLPGGVNSSLRGKSFLNDKDGSYDLSGGWFDCGDHVKFGHTVFYSAYMLLKGFAEFYAGYDDRYAYDYAGYKSANNWTFEGNGHAPNSIPDVLDEVKHATDYIIKCAKDASTFYYQVGNGNYDHKQWITSVKMQTLSQDNGGEPRPVYKNPNDAAMPALAGAALALMSRLYQSYDAAYAQKCLLHASYAYAYAKTHPGAVGSPDGGFYSPNSNWKNAYAIMLTELYWATYDNTYKNEAMAMTVAASSSSADVRGNPWGLDYSNNGDIAVYNLYLLGKPGAEATFSEIVNKHYLGNVQPDGQFNGGNQNWGPLRYNANTAFVLALYAKRKGASDAVKKYIYSNIDYILGKNSKNYSFIVGFGTGTQRPHHRNYYLSDANTLNNNLSVPQKNQQFGYMVGGKRDPNAFQDDATSYTYTEGGIDYNAGLVGALAWINSMVAPVNKFKVPDVVSNLREIAAPETPIIYPNPSAADFYCSTPPNTQIKIYDGAGREVLSFVNSNHTPFGRELSPGLYHVILYTGREQISTARIVKINLR